jgi:hypothetical protein
MTKSACPWDPHYDKQYSVERLQPANLKLAEILAGLEPGERLTVLAFAFSCHLASCSEDARHHIIGLFLNMSCNLPTTEPELEPEGERSRH